MDVPDQDGLVTATPEATKVALVGVLAVMIAAVASYASRSPDASVTAAYLALFTALFSVRVLGQIAVAVARPPWLPAMEQWNFVPYRFLLPIQIALLALMSVIALDVARGSGVFGGPDETLGAVLVPLSYAYWAAMAGRYTLRMAQRRDQRWFGGAIPIVFHCVLAAFLFVYGSFLASG
jgi:hypothetical protein